jgi:hypothetical protein
VRILDSLRYLTRLLPVVAALIAGAVVLAAPAGADGEDVADEMFFYREDGLYRYYDIRPDGSLPAPIHGGDGYTKGWDIITAVDLDGGGQDEMFFYRDDGLYRFYDIRPDASLPAPIHGGDGYTEGWDVITAIDLDGDGQDEMFFYRDDGLFRFYNVSASGSLGSPILAGDGYTPGWSAITAINLDGDLQDEMFFYRADGLFRFYDVDANGNVGSPILAGDGYTPGWSSITAVNLQGDLPVERISRFTTFFSCCENRVTNIRTMARAIDGYVVMPGETFSIDRVVGPRTTAKGYLPAPYLQNGVGKCCAIGGGVSQFGTTIHNAVFWGGYQVVSHRPHTGWISRYPLGIEATLVYSSIDYKFTNNTPTPLTIRTSSTSTSVTVELWGYQGGWQMRGFHPIGSRSSSITVLDQGGANAKRVSARVTGSAPGTVRIVRTLTQGGVARSQTWFWNYVS